MEHNPYTVILVLKDGDGKKIYRAVSVANSSILGGTAVLNIVFEFIQYNSLLGPKTIYGTLIEACVRVCSIPMEARDPAIKFRIRPLGTIGRSIQNHQFEPDVANDAEPYILAEHFTLF